MTRYREAAKKPAVDSNQTVVIDWSGAGRKKTINYIWMPDKNGNLVKKDSAFVKKSFSSLSEKAQAALAQYVIAVQNRQPTDAARKTVFNSIIDAAASLYKEGKKQTPWDVLQTQLDSAPRQTGTSISYTNYDKITSDAILQNAAKELGFSFGPFAQFGEQDLADFYTKLQDAVKAGAKQTQVVTRPDGTQETITTPSAFDAKSFAQNYLWTKVNIGDAKTIPSAVIDKVGSIRTILNANGLNYISDKEVINYALQLAKGDTTVERLQADFNNKSSQLYPLFADRLKTNPSLTVMDLAQPYVARMAKWWDIDPNSVTLDNPDLDKLLRPDGTAGKVPMKSLAEADEYFKFHPNAEKAGWAIQSARDLATGLASAMGFGV